MSNKEEASVPKKKVTIWAIIFWIVVIIPLAILVFHWYGIFKGELPPPMWMEK
jgi:uncharacterized membrane protein YvbJ